MRLANKAGRTTLVLGDGVVDLEAASNGRFSADPRQVFEQWNELVEWASRARLVPDAPLEEGVLGAPSPYPSQIFALGLNYSEHVRETGHESGRSVPPVVFTKFSSCLTGPQGEIRLPSAFVDWEVELVVVIGRQARDVREQDAWSYVAGITVGQDLSERHVQAEGAAPQFSLGKSFPGFGPIGPHIVTVDEVSNPEDLELSTVVNGLDMQRGRASQMICGIAETIVRLSRICPLRPGDLLFTGTPGGVGAGRTPQVFLKPGDVLATTIQEIGTMTHTCVSA